MSHKYSQRILLSSASTKPVCFTDSPILQFLLLCPHALLADVSAPGSGSTRKTAEVNKVSEFNGAVIESCIDKWNKII